MTDTRRVSPRDVWTVLWVTLAVALGLWILFEIRRVLVWMLIAAFAAAVLSPVVELLTGRGMRRGPAVATVVIAMLLAVTAVTYAFVQPIVRESTEFAQNAPELADRVRNAPVVRQLAERFNVESRVSEVSADLPKRLLGLSGPVFEAFKTAGQLIVGIVTIFVLAIFMLLYGPSFVSGGLNLIASPERRTYVQSVGRDVGRAVSGWVAGNLVTSLVAIVVSLIVFLILGLPYTVLLSLWVGVADLIPLVGATLGAIPAIIVAFIQSVPVGIAVVVYFIAYQQLENHVLQPYVYGRTIQLNPFVVLVAVLIGVEIAGFLGALFALPVAGAAQVIVTSIAQGRLPRSRPAEPEPAPAAADRGLGDGTDARS